MVLSDDQFKDIHAQLAAQGGFTVDPRTGAPVSSGISVAPHGNEMKQTASESTPESLKEYAGTNAPRFDADPKVKLGGWRESDPGSGVAMDYYDTPTVYGSSPEEESVARRALVEGRQEAGFRLDDFAMVQNPFHAVTRRRLGMEPHELAVDINTPTEKAKFMASQPEVQSWIDNPIQRAKWDRERGTK